MSQRLLLVRSRRFHCGPTKRAAEAARFFYVDAFDVDVFDADAVDGDVTPRRARGLRG